MLPLKYIAHLVGLWELWRTKGPKRLLITLTSLKTHAFFIFEDNAFTCYQESLTITRSILPLNHQSVGNTLHCLGWVLERQSKLSDSLKSYEESVASKRRVKHSHNEQNISYTLHSIGMVLEKLDEHDKAIRAFEEVISLQKKSPCPCSQSIAEALHNLGAIFRKQEKYSQSLEFFEESLMFYQKQGLSPNHSLWKRTLESISAVKSELSEKKIKPNESDPISNKPFFFYKYASLFSI